MRLNISSIIKNLQIKSKRFIGCILVISILLFIYSFSAKMFTYLNIDNNQRVIYNNPNGFEFILNPGYSVCGYDDESQNKIELLIYVHTAIDHFTNRKIIRESWGNRTLFPTTRIVFMVGFVPNPLLLNELNQEMNTYHDIVQSDFLDTYRNITYKAINAMKWVNKFCENVILSNYIYIF